MKKIYTYSLAMLIVIILFSCSSTLTEDLYYTNATQAYAKNNYQDAIKNFDLLVKNYPNGKRSAEASFMLGFINANDLENYTDAEKYYKSFIQKFPNHDLADDAQYELENLGKDINELPMFKELGADSTDS